MIPKKIHYCWFGRGPKNQLFYKCYESWKKFFPDFEIIEWNEDNFDVNCNRYMREAYENKKWAFVSDYARLKILYDEGGIYFDTDVEVVKRISDQILETGYLGKESDEKINTGLGFGVYPKNILIKSMLDDYNDISFVKDDGTFDLTACPERNTKSLIQHGFIVDGKYTKTDNVGIYDPEYFCGYDINTQSYKITNKTFTVHHFNASWIPKNRKIVLKTKRIISRIIGPNLYKKIANHLHHRK